MTGAGGRPVDDADQPYCRRPAGCRPRSHRDRSLAGGRRVARQCCARARPAPPPHSVARRVAISLRIWRGECVAAARAAASVKRDQELEAPGEQGLPEAWQRESTPAACARRTRRRGRFCRRPGSAAVGQRRHAGVPPSWSAERAASCSSILRAGGPMPTLIIASAVRDEDHTRRRPRQGTRARAAYRPLASASSSAASNTVLGAWCLPPNEDRVDR